MYLLLDSSKIQQIKGRRVVELMKYSHSSEKGVSLTLLWGQDKSFCKSICHQIISEMRARDRVGIEANSETHLSSLLLDT